MKSPTEQWQENVKLFEGTPQQALRYLVELAGVVKEDAGLDFIVCNVKSDGKEFAALAFPDWMWDFENNKILPSGGVNV